MAQARATDVVGVMLGEAGGKTPSQRLNDFRHIASVIANRSLLTGATTQSVISAPNQFSAYNRALPPGVEQYRALAEQAWNEVQEAGPITRATFYATPRAVDNLPGGLAEETSTASHQYFTDPENRSIRTATGYARVNPQVQTTLNSFVDNLTGALTAATAEVARTPAAFAGATTTQTPASAAIDTQFGPPGGWTSATPMGVTRESLGPVSVNPASFNDQRAQYAVGQQAMRAAVAAQQPSEVAAKTSRIGAMPADTRAQMTAALNAQRESMQSPMDMGQVGAAIGGMYGAQPAASFGSIAGGVPADARAAMTSALNDQRQAAQTPSSLSSMGQVDSRFGADLGASAARQAAMSASMPGLSSALNDQRSTFGPGDVNSLDGLVNDRRTAVDDRFGVSQDMAMSALTGGLSSIGQAIGATATAADMALGGFVNGVNTPTNEVASTPSAVTSYGPDTQTTAATGNLGLSSIGPVSGDLNSPSNEMGGTSQYSPSELNAPDDTDISSKTGGLSPRMGSLLGGVVGSAIGGPFGGLLGSLAGRSMAAKGLPAGGFGGLFGGFGTSGRGPGGGNKSSNSGSKGDSYGAGDRAGSGVNSNGPGSRN